MHSVLTNDLEHCYITGSTNVAIHHIFPGHANRKLSEEWGFVVPLRPDWHNMSNYGVHFNRELDLKLKCKCQEWWLENGHTKEEFIKIFGKWWVAEPKIEVPSIF